MTEYMANILNCGDDFKVRVSGEDTLLSISQKYLHGHKHPILLARVNNALEELHKTLVKDSVVEFLDLRSPFGFRAYQRSLVFLLLYAIEEIISPKTRVIIGHSIKKNYYCEIEKEGFKLTEDILGKIEAKMKELVKQDLPIEKFSFSLDKAKEIIHNLGLMNKEQIINYRRTSSVNFYKLNWYYNYFYGPMVPSTGCLTLFKLHLLNEGFVLQFPEADECFKLPPLLTQRKISEVITESKHWAKILGVDTVGSLNDSICQGLTQEIIKTTEALHEKKIAEIADAICRQQKPIVLIAGPSSSGKTTFAKRLSIALRVNGVKSYVLSLDDYFLGTKYYPLDEFGNPDYEHLLSLDIDQINEDLENLLNGKTVQLPKFDFKNDKAGLSGTFLTLNKGSVLILEGIHALNNALTPRISMDFKFKIFISALTQLNVDDHNRIPTSDTRLIRRIVRDSLYRKINAKKSISLWRNVAKGENENIFPYQEEADAFFNSALIYELSVLKQYAEPLLFRIKQSEDEYTEARRLIKFLDSFLVMSPDGIPSNSIIREFIGGSSFE